MCYDDPLMPFSIGAAVVWKEHGRVLLPVSFDLSDSALLVLIITDESLSCERPE